MSIEYIDTQVKARMAAQYSDTQVALDNEYFDSSGLSSWVRLSLMPNKPYSIGNKCYRENGFIAVSIFTRREKSTSEAYALADTISDIFKIKRFDGIVTELSEVVRVGVTKGEAEYWFQLNVFTPYYHDTQ